MPADPLDHVCGVFTLHCRKMLRDLLEIKRVVDAHSTITDAIYDLVLHGKLPIFAEPKHIDIVVRDIPRYRRCLARMQDIKALARRVVQCGFPDDDAQRGSGGSEQGPMMMMAEETEGVEGLLHDDIGAAGRLRWRRGPSVFDHEICFSYAAKMLVSLGLPLTHYSHRPTNDEVVRAELVVAMRTPFLSLHNCAGETQEEDAAAAVDEEEEGGGDGDQDQDPRGEVCQGHQRQQHRASPGAMVQHHHVVVSGGGSNRKQRLACNNTNANKSAAASVATTPARSLVRSSIGSSSSSSRPCKVAPGSIVKTRAAATTATSFAFHAGIPAVVRSPTLLPSLQSPAAALPPLPLLLTGASLTVDDLMCYEAMPGTLSAV
jgi:hypothetical protein